MKYFYILLFSFLCLSQNVVVYSNQTPTKKEIIILNKAFESVMKNATLKDQQRYNTILFKTQNEQELTEEETKIAEELNSKINNDAQKITIEQTQIIKDVLRTLQFAPMTKPSYEKEDLPLIDILKAVVEIDEENKDYSTLKEQYTDLEWYLASENDLYETKSIGLTALESWKSLFDGTIVSLLLHGKYDASNEIYIKAQKSFTFPDSYEITIITHDASSSYDSNKKAHNKLIEKIKDYLGFSKYADLHNIEEIPSVQGKVTGECFYHGCNTKTKIICKEDVLANIIQEKNGNQYKKNNILEFKK